MMEEDPFVRANKALTELDRRTRYDARNRRALLLIHGVIGIVAGGLILQGGPPESWLLVVGEGRDWLLAWPAIAGGVVLILGLVYRRNLILESLGMAGILGWDAMMVWVMVSGGQRPYPVAVYGGLAALMVVHVVTLVLYLWNRRRSR